jgi:hypothetical protein
MRDCATFTSSNWPIDSHFFPASLAIPDDGKHKTFVLRGDLDSITALESKMLEPAAGHSNVWDDLRAAASPISAEQRRYHQFALPSVATTPARPSIHRHEKPSFCWSRPLRLADHGCLLENREFADFTMVKMQG